MPRRPAKVTQADIARAIRAAKEAGADEGVIGRERPNADFPLSGSADLGAGVK